MSSDQLSALMRYIESRIAHAVHAHAHGSASAHNLYEMKEELFIAFDLPAPTPEEMP